MYSDPHSAMNDPTTIYILEETAQILAKPESWIQNVYTPSGGCDPYTLARSKNFCVLGAIREAYRRHRIFFNSDDTPAVEALRDALGGLRWISDWNDTPGRTHAEVLEVLKKARDLELSRKATDGEEN